MRFESHLFVFILSHLATTAVYPGLVFGLSTDRRAGELLRRSYKDSMSSKFPSSLPRVKDHDGAEFQHYHLVYPRSPGYTPDPFPKPQGPRSGQIAVIPGETVPILHSNSRSSYSSNPGLAYHNSVHSNSMLSSHAGSDHHSAFSHDHAQASYHLAHPSTAGSSSNYSPMRLPPMPTDPRQIKEYRPGSPVIPNVQAMVFNHKVHAPVFRDTFLPGDRYHLPDSPASPPSTYLSGPTEFSRPRTPTPPPISPSSKSHISPPPSYKHHGSTSSRSHSVTSGSRSHKTASSSKSRTTASGSRGRTTASRSKSHSMAHSSKSPTISSSSKSHTTIHSSGSRASPPPPPSYKSSGSPPSYKAHSGSRKGSQDGHGSGCIGCIIA
ncbi:hypothetical protein C8Q75DRAFT_810645 [Abortiporus biennis]|nr:hypothetical protein C8Q75DRAFT_810645 [Abortiporus biennis]